MAEIKINHPSFTARGIAYQIDRFEMALIQRAKLTIDLRIGNDLIKRLGLHALNNSLHYGTVTARFDNQHQLQCGSEQLDGGLSVFILSTVDDVGPTNQLA